MTAAVRERVDVLAAADLPEGGRALVEAFGTEVALFNVGGRLYALANACAHHGGPLCHGRVGGTRLASAPYENTWAMEGRVLTCPWHGWQYDLETGRTLFDSRVGVARYDVTVEDGRILLSPA